ncbi:efflux RND transporter periplasmic adaptor subunit [Jannaschia aquimarina]|uniref:MdtA_2 protein n=1 Tax=Jannaschia aquimarina TaxID=935700 RepID=A0A0D1EGG3_9RHOB|nr:efflux RND transporter periplasmic adaptor subunit [Jannaschia aquimarina]KIT14935.1 Multidrug resistance protein MdtA precursor [Jannaschia aquimarina]SNS59789.1 RND family efflux transporter, MFP subunit [Jannaschia aquimarina]
MAQDGKENAEGPGKGSVWPWLVAGLCVIAIGVAGWLWITRSEQAEPANPPPPRLVETAEVQRVDRISIRQTGFLRPAAQVEVVPEITARVVEVSADFERGRRIAEGDLLFRLDPTRIEAERSRAEARVGEARAAVAEARIEADRQRELEERGVAAETVLQTALVALASAEAALETARADLALVRDRIDDTEIRAPFDVLVVEAAADVGDLAAAGTPLGILVASNVAEVDMGLLPGDFALLPDPAALPGTDVRILPNDPAPEPSVLAKGTVHSVGAQIRDGTRLLPLIVRVPDPFSPGPDGRPLRLGELVTVELPVAIEGGAAVAIPSEALRPGGIVWRIEEGGLIRTTPELLRRESTGDGERAILRAGPVSAGDTVLLSALPEASEGLQVRTEDTQ